MWVKQHEFRKIDNSPEAKARLATERESLEELLRPYLNTPIDIEAALDETQEAIDKARLGLEMGFNEMPTKRKEGASVKQLKELRDAAGQFLSALKKLSPEASWLLANQPKSDNADTTQVHQMLWRALGARIDIESQEDAKMLCIRVDHAALWAIKTLSQKKRAHGRPPNVVAEILASRCGTIWKKYCKTTLNLGNADLAAPFLRFHREVFVIAKPGVIGDKHAQRTGLSAACT